MYMDVYVSTHTFTYTCHNTHMQKPSQAGATVVRSRAGDTNVILVNQRLGRGWYYHLYDPAPGVAGVAGVECMEGGLSSGPSSTALGPSSKAGGVTLVCAEGGLSSGPSRTASGPSRNAVVGGAGDAGTGRRLGVAEGRARARGVGALVAQCVSESVCEDHPRHQDHHVELRA